MKLNVFLLAFITFQILLSCSSPKRESKQLVERNNVTYEINSNEPFSGYLIDIYSSGQVKVKGEYLEGLKHGEWIKYEGNGQIRSKINYAKGAFDGIYEEYTLNGVLTKRIEYKDNVYNGVYLIKDKKGSIIDSFTYEDGLLNGSYYSYNTNDKSYIKTNYKSGSIDGLFQIFYKNGRVSEEYSMKNGVYDGSYYLYNLDGSTRTAKDYTNGVAKNKGTWKRYWNDNDLIVDMPSKFFSEVSFDKNGKPSSKLKFYYQNSGKTRATFNYISIEPDLLEGQATWYSEDGHILQKGNFSKNRRNGTWETYYKNQNIEGGKLKERCNYVNGVKNGKYLFLNSINSESEGMRLVNYRPQTNDGFWKLEGELTNDKLNNTWNIWLYWREQFCWYKINVYSTAKWNRGNEVENSYINLQRNEVYNSQGQKFSDFWGEYAKEKVISEKPLFCREPGYY